MKRDVFRKARVDRTTKWKPGTAVTLFSLRSGLLGYGLRVARVHSKRVPPCDPARHAIRTGLQWHREHRFL